MSPTLTITFCKCHTVMILRVLDSGKAFLSFFFFFFSQAPPAGIQGEQDGTGSWRGMLKKGEEAPGSGPGSPLKGAVNLLDVVT